MTKNEQAEAVFNQLISSKRQCCWCLNWYTYPTPNWSWDDAVFCSTMCYSQAERVAFAREIG